MYLIFSLTEFDLLLIGLLILCFLLWRRYGKKPKSRIELYLEKMAGQRRLPIVGTSYVMLFVNKEDFFNFMKRRFSLYYGSFRNWIGSIPNVNLSKPEHAEILLNNSVQINKSSAYDFLKPWLGEGLLTSSGSKWQSRRKLLTPAFHFNILDSSLEIFNFKAQLFVRQLDDIPKGKIFDIYPYVTHFALDAVCETAMGVELNSMYNQHKEYVDAIYTITTISLQRIVKPWLQPAIIFKYTKKGRQFRKCLKVLHDFTKKIIKERRATIDTIKQTDEKKDGREKKTFIDILLEASRSDTMLSDEDIRQEVDTFLFEGHDTTTAAICWCLFLLGNNLDIQDRVHDEIVHAFQDHTGPINMVLLGKLKLLDRCIKEALRLYPSVPIVARLLQKDINIDGFLVPFGCTANLYIFMVHRDPRYYDNPDKFDPDRFLPENIKKKHPYAYIPFSAGPRNCIGQKYAVLEEKVLLTHVLRRFQVRSMETEEMIKPGIDLILRPINGVRVLLKPRQQ